MKKMLIENRDLISIIDSFSSDSSEKDFISILELLYRCEYKIALYEHSSIDEIYEKFHRFRSSEDITLISNLIEKLACYLSEEEFNSDEQIIMKLQLQEGNNIKDIITKGTLFDYTQEIMKYDLFKKPQLRLINNEQDIKEILFVFLNSKKYPEEIVTEINKITNNIIFDDEILISIEKLNEGFESRKSEILYHIYCIDLEIPVIIRRGNTHYSEIGRQLTIDCSPERNRNTVSRKLNKELDGMKLKCELHTKMVRMSTKAPDRIYFCPRVPDNFPAKYRGKIYIYKITQHV